MNIFAAVFDIPKDKALHYIAGTIVALFGACAGIIFNQPAWICAFAAAGISGGVKEYIDSRGYGTVDPWDVVWTVAGAVPVAVPLFFFA